MNTIISHSYSARKLTRWNPIEAINQIIEKEQTNSIGISVALIMFGTGIASITAALAVASSSFFILMLVTVLAMGSNVMVISQRTFKTIVWCFMFNLFINIGLIIYQLAV